MKLRQLVKDGKFIVKKKRRNKKKKPTERNFEGKPLINTSQFVGPEDFKQPGMKRQDKNLPIIQQRPWEKDKTFLYRVHQLCEVCTNTILHLYCISVHMKSLGKICVYYFSWMFSGCYQRD